MVIYDNKKHLYSISKSRNQKAATRFVFFRFLYIVSLPDLILSGFEVCPLSSLIYTSKLTLDHNHSRYLAMESIRMTVGGRSLENDIFIGTRQRPYSLEHLFIATRP